MVALERKYDGFVDAEIRRLRNKGIERVNEEFEVGAQLLREAVLENRTTSLTLICLIEASEAAREGVVSELLEEIAASKKLIAASTGLLNQMVPVLNVDQRERATAKVISLLADSRVDDAPAIWQSLLLLGHLNPGRPMLSGIAHSANPEVINQARIMERTAAAQLTHLARNWYFAPKGAGLSPDELHALIDTSRRVRWGKIHFLTNPFYFCADAVRKGF
jgi:hypothetical protein